MLFAGISVLHYDNNDVNLGGSMEFILENLALVIAVLMFAIGLIGTVLPALPGAALIVLGMVVYGLKTDFESLGIAFYVLQLLVLGVISIVDFFASAISAKKYGGSKHAAFGAFIGTIGGIIFLGPLGIIIGPFIGSLVVELLLGKEIKKAISVGFGSLVGIIGGTIFKLCAEAVMIIYFFMSIK